MLAPGSLALVACLAASLWAPPSMAQTVTDLGTLPGGTSSQATAINASGQVVGNSTTANGSGHAFLYSDGVMTDLGTLGGSASWATGVNASGEVVGSSYNARLYQHAFLYSGGHMTDMGVFPRGSPLYIGGSAASGINDGGQVAGYSRTESGDIHAFRYWDPVMADLGTLGGSSSEANGINASAQVVGDATTANGDTHAFLWSSGVMTDLGTLPGGAGSVATAINDSGQVAGYSGTADVSNHAFLYSNGVMTDLGTLGGYSSAARAINSSGEVVGYADSAIGGSYAFLYSHGVMTDLNSLLPANSGWVFGFANAINDCGQIAGYISVGLWQHAVLLNLTTLSPSSAAAGGAAFTLTVNRIGTNFVPGATVNWNGTALATSFVSETQMTANVPARLIAAMGTARVTVTTTAGTLAGATFAIHGPRGLPQEPERPRNTAPRAQQ